MLEDKLSFADISGLIERGIPALTFNDELSMALAIMQKHACYSLPVVSGKGHYEGMLALREIAPKKLQPSAHVASVFTRAPALSESDLLIKAIGLMWKNRMPEIAVLNGSSLAGVLSFRKIMRWAVAQPETAKIRLSEIKIRAFPLIGPHTQADKAKAIMRDNDVGRALVLDGEWKEIIDPAEFAKKLSGYFKRKSTLGEKRGEKLKWLGFDSEEVSQVPFARAHENSSLADLIAIMDAENVNCVLAGSSIVTYWDILRHLDGLMERPEPSDIVAVVGARELPKETVKGMKAHLNHFLGLYARKYLLSSISQAKVTIKETRRQGARKLYEMSFRIYTTFGTFYCHRSGWNAFSVFNDLVDAMKGEIFSARRATRDYGA